jgi:hypothetical protein
MGTSLIEMQEMVRAEMGYPALGSPNPRQIISKLLQHAQNLTNHASNTGHAWDEYELPISVSPGVADYQLNDTRFGKALVAYTRDDSNQSHYVRTIPVFELEDLNYDWNMPNDIGSSIVSYDGSTHSALRIGYFRRAGVPYLRFQPVPQAVNDYDVLFITGDWASGAALTDSPIFAEHNHLIVVRAAISLLADAEWVDDPDVNERKAAKKKITLDGDAAEFSRQFDAWILSTHAAQIGTRWMPDI